MCHLANHDESVNGMPCLGCQVAPDAGETPIEARNCVLLAPVVTEFILHSVFLGGGEAAFALQTSLLPQMCSALSEPFSA